MEAGGDVAVSFTLPLPAPDGSPELERALAATEALRSATMREELRGEVGGEELVANYRFAAPDAFEIRVGDSHRIVIGARRWQRSSPAEAWEEGRWPGEPFRWPTSHYRAFWADRAAVRVVGEEEVEGVASRVVAFVRPGLPAWFRVWVGIDDGLVRREEMLAEGHLMHRVYEQLDGPAVVVPPVDEEAAARPRRASSPGRPVHRCPVDWAGAPSWWQDGRRWAAGARAPSRRASGRAAG